MVQIVEVAIAMRAERSFFAASSNRFRLAVASTTMEKNKRHCVNSRIVAVLLHYQFSALTILPHYNNFFCCCAALLLSIVIHCYSSPQSPPPRFALLLFISTTTTTTTTDNIYFNTLFF